MKSKRTFILSTPYSLFLTCFLLLWTGCTNEDIIGGENKDGDPVTVTLSLSSTPVTAGDHEWETKSETLDEFEPEANELMHSATVFVCDEQGTIVAKASTENLEDKEKYTFTNEVTLKTGSYTLYGFANCEYLSELNDVLKLSVDNKMSQEVTDNTLVIDDPAGKIDFDKGQYIPMTGFQSVTVDASTTKLSVSVDRLVSKAMFKITYPEEQEDNEAVTIKSLVLEGNRQRVPLFLNDEYTTNERGEGDPIELIQTPINDFSVGDEEVLPALYLNESLLRNPYRLKMQVKDEENPRNGSFNRRMTRNHVRPIEIQITNIKLWVDGYYNNDPIGAVLNPVAFSHAYTLEMQEGSTFHLDLHLKSRGKDVDNTMAPDIQWSHEFKGRSWQIRTANVENKTEGDKTVSHYILDGAVPANGAGEGEAELDITVTYTDPDRPNYNRELNFTLHLKRMALNPDHPSPTKSLLRRFSWEEIIEM